MKLSTARGKRLTKLTALLGIASTSLFLLLTPGRPEAAEISHQPDPSGIEKILFEGIIAEEDKQTFLSAIGSSQKGVVILNSQGGSVMPALAMGTDLRLKGLATAVPGNALCASACALMWLAGSPRLMGRGAKIGFHEAYIIENGQLKPQVQANALIGGYLARLGLSDDAIAYVTKAPPEGMEWLDAATAQVVGIDVQFIDDSHTDADSDTYNPLATAKLFYYALGAGDGETASAFIAPEIQGIAAFQEANMTRFFGSMRQPLRVLSASLVDQDHVSVEYTYVASSGHKCNATAYVTTTFEYEKTFITRVSANC